MASKLRRSGPIDEILNPIQVLRGAWAWATYFGQRTSKWRACGPTSTTAMGKPRVYNRPVLCGIVFVTHNGLRSSNAQKDYGPHNTLYNGWKRWGEVGLFVRMLGGIGGPWCRAEVRYCHANYLKAPHGIESAGQRCWTFWQRRSACLAIAAITPTGSEAPRRKGHPGVHPGP
jgi:hypothetical protein